LNWNVNIVRYNFIFAENVIAVMFTVAVDVAARLR